MIPKTSPNLLQILQQRFSFSEFRDGQREAIEALLHHGSLLCILPTGHGKSLLYQLPAVLFEGMTLVISPLLALMRDQLSHLNNRFHIPSASINSDQSDSENFEARRLASEGKLKILFVSPEQLDNLDTFQFLLSLNIDFLVVDEAHCISTWGHDFRPSYRQIVNAVSRIRQSRPNLKLLGITATADKKTEDDIALQLQFAEPRERFIHRYSMDRPNLFLNVMKVDGSAEKLQCLTEILREEPGPALIYCATRENTVMVSQFLQSLGFSIEAYHAGLTSDEKRALQQQFFSGKLLLIAATNALGMGIDKQDVRLIVHFDVPGSITAYYQEVGRAGRDGKPARGILLFDEHDRKIQEHFIRSAQPDEADFQKVLSVIPFADVTFEITQGGDDAPTITAVKARSGLHPTLVTVIIAELIDQGFIAKHLSGRKQIYVRTRKGGYPDLSGYIQRAQVRTKELGAMMAYGEGDVDCYMAFLRRALGDGSVVMCERCGYCVNGKRAGNDMSTDLPTISHRQSSKSISQWLEHRFLPIESTVRPKMSEGLAVLNGSLRTKTFLNFMRARKFTEPPASSACLSPELKQLIEQAITQLRKKYALTLVVMIPSKTWAQRQECGDFIASLLGVSLCAELLYWKEEPKHRQGELLNNDQRRENVKGKLGAHPLQKSGAILLVDDYLGSGATIKEAVDALRDAAPERVNIVPFTIAKIRWRLGQRGMV